LDRAFLRADLHHDLGITIRWFCWPVFIGAMLRKRMKRKIDTDSADQVAKHNQDTDSETILRNLD